MIILNSILLSQIYIPADPFNLLFLEHEAYISNSNFTSLSLRPTFYDNFTGANRISIKYKSELFYNTNAPNLENMSDRWIGKGAGFFSSINISFLNKHIMGSIEPYYFIDQNANYDEPLRIPMLSQLNDNKSHHKKSPYQAAGIREFQLYLHRKGIGTGISNANMWWGPGMQSSLVMTNNTSGFTHFLLGTLEEKRFRDWGFIGRYVFSKFDNRNKYEPYLTSVIFGLTYYSDPIVSLGITKSVLNGGSHPLADAIEWSEAALDFLGGVLVNEKWKVFQQNWSYDDITMSGYISTYFPKSKLTLFLELGRNDIAWDINNIILVPDHSLATNFGIRKYHLFNHKNLFFGLEYTKLFAGRYLYTGQVGPWYNREGYEYSSFNGRHFAAHSGPDSDDFLIFLGWQSKNYTLIPSFNYERHGLQAPAIQLETGGIQNSLINPWPETKFELRIDFRYKYKGYNLNLYLEEEVVKNLEFRDKNRTGTVLWIGIERTINTNEIEKSFKNLFKSKN